MGRRETWRGSTEHNRTTEHQQAVGHPYIRLFLRFSHFGTSRFLIAPPRRLIPNVPDGFETRRIGPGAECGRKMNALSESTQRPTREHQPDAVRPIKSASLGLSPPWVVVLPLPARPIPDVSAASKLLVLVGRGIHE